MLRTPKIWPVTCRLPSAASATTKGATFLKSRQKADGSWSSEKGPGITGLVVTSIRDVRIRHSGVVLLVAHNWDFLSRPVRCALALTPLVLSQALAIFVLFRRDGSTAAFPLEKSADYGLSPRLVSTRPQPALPYERWDAVLAPGDVLIGCTDAVAKWTLQGIESADRPAVFRLLLDVLGDGATADPAEPPAGAGGMAH